MIRRVLGAVLGYVALGLFVMATLAAAYNLLGADFAFPDGTSAVSGGWIVTNLVLGVIGALIGGIVAAAIGRGFAAARILAISVLILGVGMGVYEVFMSEPRMAVDIAEMTMMEAASEAVRPAWYNFVVAVIGFLGVWVGGRWWSRR